MTPDAVICKHDWDVKPTGSCGTENTYTWTCKDCGKVIEVDV